MAFYGTAERKWPTELLFLSYLRGTNTDAHRLRYELKNHTQTRYLKTSHTDRQIRKKLKNKTTSA